MNQSSSSQKSHHGSVNQTSDTIKSKAEHFGEKAHDMVNEAMEQGHEAAAEVKDFASETLLNLERRIREKPLQSAAIAAGVGFVLALLARR